MVNSWQEEGQYVEVWKHSFWLADHRGAEITFLHEIELSIPSVTFCPFSSSRVHKLLHIFLQQLNCQRHSVAVWAKYLRPIYQFLSKIGGILFGCRDWGEKGCLCAKCQNELGKLRFAVKRISLMNKTMITLLLPYWQQSQISAFWYWVSFWTPYSRHYVCKYLAGWLWNSLNKDLIINMFLILVVYRRYTNLLAFN